MKSSGTCAISGAFLLFGGWAAVVWVFLRALSIHLQICWEMVPGNRFFYTSLVVGWLIPAVALTITLSLTGVSFRFGNVCHVNHKLALQNFWGPMLALAALALVLQFITLGYCVHVYIKSLVNEGSTTNSSGRAPTYSGSISTASARATYRRVKRVIELQWRGATIVLLIIGEVAFFSVVFVSMDNSSQMSDELLKRSMPWLMCLFSAQGDKNQCLHLIGDMVKSEGVVLAVLIVLGVSVYSPTRRNLTDLPLAEWILVLAILRPLVDGPWVDRSHQVKDEEAE
jgi:7 transmembrane receptor (Secretin family)